MKNTQVEKILNLIKLTNKLRLVKRGTKTNDSGRYENDLEHSYQLAMLVWYINDFQKINLDEHKLLKYSLVHDLIEVYAGDYNTYIQKISDKKKELLEQKSFEVIKKEFGGFPSLLENIEKYEKLEDEESKFVYSVDKIMSALNSLVNKNGSYKKAGVTKEMFFERNLKKVSKSKYGKEIFTELIKYIENYDSDFFIKK